MLNKVKYCIFLITFNLLIFGLIPDFAIAQTTIYSDNFNSENLNPSWSLNNFTLEDSGSSGSYPQELLFESPNGFLRFHGTTSRSNTTDTVVEDAQEVGWLGKSLVLQIPLSQQENKIYSAEVDLSVQSYINEFQSHIFIELDSDNRIIFSIGNEGTTPGFEFSRTQLVLDENDSFRCVGPPDSEEIQSGCVNVPTTDIITGNKYRMRLEFNSSSRVVKAFINEVLIHQGTFNPQIFGPLNFGLASTVRKYGDYLDITFDNFSLTSIPAGDILDVPSLKQYDPPWNDDEYDHASEWEPAASDDTFERWGCAVTSAAMVLQHHGFDTNPDELNEWLKSQEDGFTRNGGVMWPAISRYTDENASGDLQRLEFTYNDPDTLSLSDEIGESRPPILKMLNSTTNGTHFIVAKGTSGENDFKINDPASSTNTLLTEAENDWGIINRVGVFTPSNTDLSYIVLYVNSDFSIKVFDDNGVELTGGNFIEYPIINALNRNETSGETLNAFYYAKPNSGNYRVNIIGGGFYQLDTYLYDKHANVIKKSFTGDVSENNSDFYILNFSKDNPGDSSIQELNFTTLKNILKKSYENGDIFKKTTFILLKNEILTAERHYKNGNTRVVKTLLRNITHRLEIFSPRLMTEDSADILGNYVYELIKSI